MQRKNFLKASGLFFGSSLLSPATQKIIHRDDTGNKTKENLPFIPPYLKKGDCVGITSPAGYISLEDIQPAVEQLQSWGFRVLIGSTIGKRHFTFGGTDDERLQDLQMMMENPDVHAIMCARGGYGMVRIIDQVKWKHFKQHPKWIIGFSDITVMHAHLDGHRIASIHSKMTNSFPTDPLMADEEQAATIDSIRKALSGEPMLYSFIPSIYNRHGEAEGKLVGGNLRTLETLAATPSDIDTRGKILFLEDTGEYMYSIDRMFWNLKRSGKLAHLKGLIIGGFRIKTDIDGEDFGKTLQEVVLEKVVEYKYPVCFDFPVGHQRNNFALKCGVPHRLVVSAHSCTLSADA